MVSSPARSSSSRASWWITFVLVGAVGSCWALASPPYSAVDEPLHVVKAVSIAGGQWVGDALPNDEIPDGSIYRDGWVTFDVPSVYGEAEESSRCFRGEDVTEPASCFSFTGSRDTVSVISLDPRYPPAYYLTVGLPARLVPDGPNAVRVMRLVSVAIVAALLASAVRSLCRIDRPTPALVGLVVATTPMVFHLAGSVNPNGVEIGAAVALWASGLVLVREAPGEVDLRVVTRVAVAALILVLSRPASPLFALLILLALLLLAGRASLMALLRSWPTRLAAGAIAVAAVAQLTWNQFVQPNYFGTPIPDVVPRSDVVRFAFGKTIGYLQQSIGVFGAPDFQVNTLTILIWAALSGGLGLLAVAVARRRFLLVMIAVAVAAVVIPVVADVSQADRFTYAWQGRYTMPLVLGLPLLAGVGIASSAPASILLLRRLLLATAGAFALGQFLAYAEFLQRYTVGIDGPLLFALDPVWRPPVPAVLLLLVVLIGVSLFGALPMVVRSDRSELVEQRVVGDATTTAHSRAVEHDVRDQMREPDQRP